MASFKQGRNSQASKTVMVFGSFDHIHPGHLHFFRQARAHGQTLIVVVARDETIRRIKGRSPVFTDTERREHLLGLPEVDEAILGDLEDKFKVIESVRPDVICLGHDQHHFADLLPEELERRGLKIPIIRLAPYRRDIYRSSSYRRQA